ncbi:acetylornithine deacetylase [Halalkalibacter wakoensis JCM 9140]|uniref:Acetylornithine deacetylase n=1 Tax=Halalkalibacter wakoensis JCM 9140 TaxID=1236970 RepID=W4PYX9_9BACI|nr:peptidase [Halalkalibacter wakoensis]GAE24917.1 acetylornithine deacetylase [Halalkalibacter wakoensis JCM 9140]
MKHEGLKVHISKWLHIERESGIALLQKLVQADSTQGNEKNAQAIIIEELTKMGLDIDVWDPDGNQLKVHPHFASSRHDFHGSPNVVGVLKGKGGGRSVILNGHIDVVPAGDREQWDYEPFSGMVVDDKMYGRGVTDMKGGNVSLLLAIQAIQSLPITLKGDIIFESVIEEESGGAGTLASILRGYKADAAIVPEPTSMKIFPKQQGSMWFRLFVKGRSAHGGTRYEGVSAIDKSLLVLKHIEKLETKRNQLINDPLYSNVKIPIPINVGKIEGGNWPSSVADLVTIEGRIGVSPGETLEEAKKQLEEWLMKLADKDPWFQQFPVKLEWFGARWVPGSVDPDHPLVELLSKNYVQVVKKEPVIEASPWGTDGGLLTEIGKTPSVIFGPGLTEQAHFPNEYIQIDQVFQAAEIIACTLLDWCEFELQ